MQVFIIIIHAAALICLASLLICGLYLGANKNKVEDYVNAARFHRTLGIVTVVLSAAAILI